jgi:hypothetical protein
MEIGYTVTVKFTVDDFNTQTLYLVNEDLKDEDGIYLPAKSASIVSVEPPPLTLETCNRVIYRPYNGGDIPYNGGDIIGTPQYIGSTIVVFIETQTGNEISCYKSECEPYD